MKFTVGWLKDYLNFNDTNKNLCDKLTSIGLEVEYFFDPREKLKNFIVSKVLDVKKHPNADKLSICEVFDGKQNLKIICGAPNVRKNLLTVLAPIGTVIKEGSKEEFTIKKSSIRGEESNGMLCSEEELELTGQSDGIIELNGNYEVGQSYSNYLDDESSEIEIAITPNRVDCAGVYGVARDLSAAGFGTLKEKKVSKIEANFESNIKIVNELKNQDCPKFSLRLIKNVKNNESNNFITKRFIHSGLKKISSLVDITNYITIDSCRPLHVFDLDKLEGNLRIRYSKKGENFVGLDDVEYTLDDGMIVICDEKKIVSLAGIMGGKNSGCDLNTKNVILESAYFLPENIAKTGRKLNIQSDARYRFERGIDPESIDNGLDQASQMIKDFCGGDFGSIVSDNVSLKERKSIEIQCSFFEKILGTKIDFSFIKQKLSAIGCKISENKTSFFVTPPTWRQDINIPEDLVEEVGRLFGYHNINSKEISTKNLNDLEKTSELQKVRKKLKQLLVSRDMFEMISWSFTDKKIEDILKNTTNPIEINNPISSELSCLRSSLVGNLLMTIQKNVNRNLSNFSVFEVGPVFLDSESYQQEEYASGIRAGFFYEKSWLEKQREVDIFDLKADLYASLKLMNINIDSLKVSKKSKPYYHPGRSGTIFIGNEEIGYFGEIHPNIINELEIKNNCCAFELNLTKSLSFSKKVIDPKSELKVSPYQASIRDFSFELKREILSDELVRLIKKIDKDLIKEAIVFDNYEGEKIDKDYKAVAISVKIQSDNKTLQDSEINKLSEKIISSIIQKFDAKQR